MLNGRQPHGKETCNCVADSKVISDDCETVCSSSMDCGPVKLDVVRHGGVRQLVQRGVPQLLQHVPGVVLPGAWGVDVVDIFLNI